MYRVIKILDFFQKLRTSPHVLMPVDASFQTLEECGLQKNLSKIKTGMCLKVYLILMRNMRRQPGETRDPLTQTSRTKEIANKVRHKRQSLHNSI